MIVFLNVNKKEIDLYTDGGKKTISFEDVNKLYEFYNDEKIYYITNAVETDIKSIADVIEQSGIKVKAPNPLFLSKKKYIHSISNGTIVIDEELSFEGKYDIKDYNQDIINKIKQSPLLKTLIDRKKIEIIGEAKKYTLMEEKKIVRQKKKEVIKKSDEKASGLIINKPVAEFDGSDSDDSLDITNDVLNYRDIETENEMIIRKLGIK